MGKMCDKMVVMWEILQIILGDDSMSEPRIIGGILQ